MTDNTELKRLAERVIDLEAGDGEAPIGEAWDEFEAVATPSAVLAQIAENERLRVDLKSVVRLNNENADLFKEKNDQLRAEIAGLKTGYEAYERVNAELKGECARSTEREILQLAEIEALRKALVGILDLYDTDEGCRSLPQYINGRAALGQGEKS